MGKKFKIDFTGVDVFKKCSEGRHLVKAVKFEEGTTVAGEDKVVATLQIVTGDDKGCNVYETFTFGKGLFKLKGFLMAVNAKSDGKIVLDFDKLVGKQCEIEVFHEEYEEGKVRVKIDNFYVISAAPKVEDIEEEEEEEEEVVAPPKKEEKKPKKEKPAPKVEKEEEEDNWDDDDDDDWD